MLKLWISIGTSCIEQGIVALEEWRAAVRAQTDVRVEPYFDEIRQWSLIMMYQDHGHQTGKMNCWDVMKCSMTGEGIRGRFRDVCPARLETRLDGIHGGMNGGRACWTVSNTLCGSLRQAPAAQCIWKCADCRFFRQVHDEEPRDVIVVDAYLNSLLI